MPRGPGWRPRWKPRAEGGRQDLFAHPTVAALAAAIDAGRGDPGTPEEPGAAPATPGGLSGPQRGLWAIHQAGRDDGAYVVHAAFRLDGALDEAGLRAGFTHTLAAHPALRSAITVHAGVPRLSAEPCTDALSARAWRTTDLSARTDPWPEAERLAARDADRPFDLTRPPLVRAHLIRTAPTTHLLTLTAHHIICDDTSMSILLSTLTSADPIASSPPGGAADVRRTGPGPALRARTGAPEPPIGAPAVVGPRPSAPPLGGPRLSAPTVVGPRRRTTDFWAETLRDAPSASGPAPDHPYGTSPATAPDTPPHPENGGGPAHPDRSGAAPGATHRFTVPAGLARRFATRCRGEGATTVAGLLAVLAIVSATRDGGDDLVVGTPVSARPDDGYPDPARPDDGCPDPARPDDGYPDPPVPTPATPTPPAPGAAVPTPATPTPPGTPPAPGTATPTPPSYAPPAGAPDAFGLRAFCADRLPAYLVPDTVVVLDALPTTSTGKVDTTALPEPPAAPAAPADPPRTATEGVVAAIWATVLHRSDVDRSADFFALGGHSLIAAHVLAAVRDRLGVTVPMRTLFAAPTVAAFAAVVDDGVPADLPTPDRLRADAVPPPEIRLRAAPAPGTRLGTAPPPGVRPPGVRPIEVRPFRVRPPGVPSAGRPRRILLTGATGFLGRHLLDQLLARTDARIHCLVRRGSIDRLPVTDRVIPVPGDLAAPGLGLSTEDHDTLTTVDAIYHNAAVPHFAASYDALKSAHVDATAAILRLAGDSGAPLHLTSTLGVFLGDAHDGRVVTEADVPTDPSGLTSGYDLSKWVADAMSVAARGHGLPVSVHRIAAIVGDTVTGATDPRSAFSRWLTGCVAAGAVPDTAEVLDMVPVDTVAAAIVALSQAPEASWAGTTTTTATAASPVPRSPPPSPRPATRPRWCRTGCGGNGCSPTRPGPSPRSPSPCPNTPARTRGSTAPAPGPPRPGRGWGSPRPTSECCAGTWTASPVPARFPEMDDHAPARSFLRCPGPGARPPGRGRLPGHDRRCPTRGLHRPGSRPADRRGAGHRGRR
ncbi:hypothetical protein SGRI78S_01882 [Streptomyces griseus subsp. griseus]